VIARLRRLNRNEPQVLLADVSRVFPGVHYPADVLGGWRRGFVWAASTCLATRRFERALDRGRAQAG
jgi:membrane-associated phospholipid phosphatase